MKKAINFLFAGLLVLNGCNNAGHRKAGKKFVGLSKYQLVSNWPNFPDGFRLGNPAGIGIDSDQHIFIFHRAGREWPLLMPIPQSFIAEKTILMLDNQTGKILNSWGAGIFIMPHGLTVDQNNNIWVTDVGLQQVFKFSHEGTLLMKLGEAKVTGSDTAHFNLPTDVAVDKDGSFYVSDGYGNSRIIKFSSAGKWLLEWGKKGNQPGEFNISHAIDLDKKGNVYVADRENSRIQIFDSVGNFLEGRRQKNIGKIYALAVDKEKNNLVTIDYRTRFLRPEGSDILVSDSSANLLARFGRSGLYDGPVCRYHDVAIDKEGNIFTGDILGNIIQKFKRVTP